MRVILEADEMDNLRFGLSAALWLLRQPESQKDAILGYMDDVDFYVRRNKSSVSARQLTGRK